MLLLLLLLLHGPLGEAGHQRPGLAADESGGAKARLGCAAMHKNKQNGHEKGKRREGGGRREARNGQSCVKTQNTRAHTRTHTHTHARTHARTHAHAHIRTHAC